MRYVILILILFSNLYDLRAQTFSFYRTSPEVIYTNDTFGVISSGRVNNLTGDSVRIRIVRTVVNIPQGWETCMCDIVQCHPPGMDTATADYPPGLSNIEVMLWAHSIPGTGYVTFKAEKVSNTNENYTVTFGGAYNPLGINLTSSEIPTRFELYQNYPNPFNPMTNFKFQIPKSGLVNLKVYDILGNEIEILLSKQLNPGTYEVSFNASQYPSGVYFYTLRYDGYFESRKMILIK